MSRMKGALVLYLTLISLVSFVQCFPGKGYKPLENILIKAQSLERSDNHVDDENSGQESSPVYIGPQEGLKAANKITALPGQPEGLNFDQYSGYVTVDPKAGRALFYYFAESQNCSSKPLVLWLNGVYDGACCSSLGIGAMTEQGPFRVNKDGKTLWYNEYAWNKVANTLFLESPAGVGFSYSNTSSDYHNAGDNQTAKDSYTFLVNWLERFPEYKTRDFYITGEGYAGHYILQLAHLVLRNNKIANQTVINLKGIAIGNAFVDIETYIKGQYDFRWTHSLISDEIYQGLVSNCTFSSEDRESDACQTYWEQEIKAIGNINYYDIYAPLCSSVSAYDPCVGDYVLSYLNNPEVQKSLHVNATGIPGPWSTCSNLIANWTDSPETVLPTINELMASGISIWLYSGDTDCEVPVTTTRYAINKLGVSVKTPWYAWYTQGEVGGYVEEYENLTFVTVRGAGHFVPRNQPARALSLISSFLEGKLPPSNQNSTKGD